MIFENSYVQRPQSEKMQENEAYLNDPNRNCIM